MFNYFYVISVITLIFFLFFFTLLKQILLNNNVQKEFLDSIIADLKDKTAKITITDIIENVSFINILNIISVICVVLIIIFYIMISINYVLYDKNIFGISIFNKNVLKDKILVDDMKDLYDIKNLNLKDNLDEIKAKIDKIDTLDVIDEDQEKIDYAKKDLIIKNPTNIKEYRLTKKDLHNYVGTVIARKNKKLISKNKDYKDYNDNRKNNKKNNKKNRNDDDIKF